MIAPVRRTVVVLGAGAHVHKSTVALNLAVAAAALGVETALRDLDGASSRALRRALGAHADAPSHAEADAPAIDSANGSVARLPWTMAPLHLDARDPRAALVVVDPPPRLDDEVRALVRAADLVLVPVDASPLARRLVRETAALAVGGAPRLALALARRLPRETDRWALVEALDAEAPGALLATTLPMGSAPRGRGRTDAARLYAPRTAAARAYATLVRALGLLPAVEVVRD